MKSGKYKVVIMKGHVIIGLTGLILHDQMDLGVDNDDTIMDDIIANADSGWDVEPGEWGLGDKAYIAIERMLCANKPEQTQFDTLWNSIIAFYRSRVEIVIARLKKHEWCKTPFRGSFKSLTTYNEIRNVLTALEIRREIEKGEPMFEVCGPWPHDFT